ncbi:hypothetical protein HYV70_05180 [Candidatus Uhrbacteria bacterium]|nr:hypothetical protein [Candidatus Uhrbacteria bacterium]
MQIGRPKDRLSSVELRELFANKIRDFDSGRGMEIPHRFPDELEGLCFSLCVLDRVIGNLFARTDESACEYPVVRAYACWTIVALTRNRRITNEHPDEEAQVQALVEFLIKETRWTDRQIEYPRSQSGFMNLVDELNEEQRLLSLEETEPGLDEDYPDEEDDHFGRLIGWIEK